LEYWVGTLNVLLTFFLFKTHLLYFFLCAKKGKEGAVTGQQVAVALAVAVDLFWPVVADVAVAAVAVAALLPCCCCALSNCSLPVCRVSKTITRRLGGSLFGMCWNNYY